MKTHLKMNTPMTTFKVFIQSFAVLLSLLFFVGCQQEEIVKPVDDAEIEERQTISSTSNVAFWGVDAENHLYQYRSGPPATLVNKYLIRGLRDGEFVTGIDFRPATRVLYGVTNMNSIYTISTVDQFGSGTLMARLVSTTPFTPGIDGAIIGFDFNPVSDRITIVTDKGKTFQISPTTGQVIAVSSTLTSTGAMAGINGAAFFNNYAGTTGTTLYDIDFVGGKLYRQTSNGVLYEVGSTGLTISGEGGFDISRSGAAFGVFLANGRNTFSTSPTNYDDISQQAYRLWNINLKTGQATSYGKVFPMIGLAIQL